MPLLTPTLLLATFGAHDYGEEQCMSLAGERWIGVDTTVVSLGSLPDFDYFDPREVRRRGPNGEVIVPLIGLHTRVEWVDGVSFCVDDPFARVTQARKEEEQLPVGWTIEHDEARRARGQRDRVRVVVDNEPLTWHDDLDGLRWTPPRPAPNGEPWRRWGYVARDGATMSVHLDGRVVDTFPSSRRQQGEFGFSADGRAFFWNVERDTTKILDAHGTVHAFPCSAIRRRGVAVGERGIALDCLFGGAPSVVVVTGDGGARAFARFSGQFLESWWMSADAEHFISATDRWVIVDGVRGPEAEAIWDLVVDEGAREVRYLARVKTLAHYEERTQDVVAVTMPWPRDFCGEPFTE